MKLHEKLYGILQPLVVSSKPEDAITALSEVLHCWPDLAIVHNDIGVLLYNEGKKEEALAHYEAAVKYDPENIIFQKNLADFYYVEKGRVGNALEIYLKILKSNPEDIETLLVTGHICVSLERFDDAKQLYRRVLEAEPWHSEVRENLEKLERMGRPSNAFESPDDMYQNIREEAEQVPPNKLIQDLTELLQFWPEYATAHNDLGVLYYNNGEKAKARNHYEQAVQHEPENLTFRKNLADYYYVEEGRTEDALRSYVKILEQAPEDIEALWATAQICEGMKRQEDARVFYNRILEIEPWHNEAMQRLETISTPGI